MKSDSLAPPPLGPPFDPELEFEPEPDEFASLSLLFVLLGLEPESELDDPTFDPACEAELWFEFEVLSPDEPCPLLEDPDSEPDDEPGAGGWLEPEPEAPCSDPANPEFDPAGNSPELEDPEFEPWATGAPEGGE